MLARLIQFIGAGKVGYHPLQCNVRQLLQFHEKSRGVSVLNPQTPHTGIDLEVNLCLAEELASGVIQGLGLLQGKDDCGKIVADAFSLLAGIDSAQQQDRLVNAGFAELDPLGQEGYAKCIDSQTFQLATDIHEAVAIGIGLDHRQNLRLAGDG